MAEFVYDAYGIFTEPFDVLVICSSSQEKRSTEQFGKEHPELHVGGTLDFDIAAKLAEHHQIAGTVVICSEDQIGPYHIKDCRELAEILHRKGLSLIGTEEVVGKGSERYRGTIARDFAADQLQQVIAAINQDPHSLSC
jgi:hypothetical protein